MENKIKHVGIVESTGTDRVKVRIVQSSACAMCKAAKQCHASESKEKIVDVFTDKSDKYTAGQRVIVTASYNVGLIAVCLGMVIPMFLLIVAIAVATALGHGEITAAVSSIATLIPYYIMLYLFRRQINRRVTFNIEDAEE